MLVFGTLKGNEESVLADILSVGGKSVTQRLQDRRDKKFVNAFNSIIAGGDIDNFNAIPVALEQIGLDAEKVSQELLGAAENSDGAAIAIKEVGTASKDASVGMKALAVVGNMVATALISFAVTKAIQGIEYLANYADHMAENLEESKSKVAENESAIADMNKELDETKRLIKELEGLSSLNPIQQEQLNMAKEQRIELERRLAVEQALLRVNQRQKSADYVKAFYSRTGGSAYRAVKTYNPELITKDMESYGVDAAFAKNMSFITSGDGNNPVTYFTEAGLFEANKAAYKKNLEKIKELRQDSFDAEAKGLDEDIIEYNKKIAKLEEENETLIGNMSEYVKELQTAAEGISYIEGDHLSPQEKATNDMLDYTSYVGESFADLENSARAQSDFEAVFESEVFSEQAKKLEELAKAGELTAQALSAEEFGGIMAEWEELGWAAEQVAKQINDSIGKAPDAPKYSLDSLYSSLFKNTEAYTKLTEAMNEQNEAGVLSFETYTALIEANSEFAELLELTAEGWTLNSEALWTFLEAQDEMVKGEALAHIQDLYEQLAENPDDVGIQNEIDRFAALIREIDSATGALAKFKAAQSTENQDADFGVGGEAYEVIKEGNKTGKIGTDDYKSAVGFMLGENWETEYAGNLDKAYKEAEKLGKRYFGQKDERTGMANFRDDVVKAGLGSFDGKTFELFDNVTLEETADKLGMSLDAVKSMFGLMEAYGANFEFPEIISVQDLKNIENMDLAQSQAALESYKTKAQEINAELKKLEETGNGPGTDQYDTLNQELQNVNATITALEGHISGMDSEIPLETQIQNLKTALDQMQTDGIEIPITLTGEYEELKKIFANGGIDVSGLPNGVEPKESKKQSVAIKDAYGDILVYPDGRPITDAYGNPYYNPNGTVDLTKRTPVTGQKLIDKGWDGINPEDIATVFSSGFIRSNWGITATPIAQNGAVFSPEQLNQYIDSLKFDPKTGGLAKGADPFGLVLDVRDMAGTTTKEKESLLNAIGEAIHQYQEHLFGNNIENIDLTKAEVTKGEPFTSTVTPVLDDSEMDKFFDEHPEIEVEAQAIPENGQQFTQQLEGYTDPLNVDVSANTQEFGEEITEATPESVETTVNATVETVGNQAGEITVGANTSGAQSSVNSLQSGIESETVKPVTIDATSAYSKLSSLESRLSQSVTKTVYIKEVGGKNASGTKHAVGGRSLVDEKGAELIEHVSQGTYELGTNEGPRMTHLNPGDVVHTASETKKILSRAAKVGGFFRDGLNNAKAWIGNAFATGVSGSMSWKKINSVLSGSGSSKKNSSSSSKASNWSKYAEQLFDWIEIRLERLQVQTKKWMLAASEAIGFISKNNELDKALTSTSQQIEETTQAYQQYIEQANIIAQKTKLSADIITKIQNGAIDIASYNDDTQKKIQEYQEWWNKAEGCVEALTELREQERELATQKLDSILDHYQWRIDRLDSVVSSNDAMLGLKAATGIRIEESDYAKSIEATTKKIQELTASRAALADEFADMVERGYIAEGSELWYEYTGELENLDETIIETKTDLQDLVDAANNITLTNLQYAMDALENSASTMEQMMGLHEAQGADHSDTDYEGLIKNGMAQIKNLEAQNAELLKQQAVLEPLSEKYQELQEQIDGNNQSILDLKTSQEQWNDAVIDLKIGELEKYKEQLSKTNDEYQRQKELQQAIEDLERARSQRKQKVYKEGKVMPLCTVMCIETSEYIG